MKLFASPFACSGAVQIVLTELGISAEVEYVDIYSQPHTILSDRSDYALVNPKNAVPALELNSGEILTEVGVILQYVADLRPEASLFAPIGDIRRLRVMEWLSFIGSDVHKSIGPLFNPKLPPESKTILRQNLVRRLFYIDQVLANRSHLIGETFSIADAYLFIMMGWEPFTKFDFSDFKNLSRYHAQISSRPSVARFKDEVEPILALMPVPDFLGAKGLT